MHPTVHVEIARSPRQARLYCQKTDTRAGTCSGGHVWAAEQAASITSELTEAISSGATDRELAREYGLQFTRQLRSVEALRYLLDEPRFDPPTVTVIWGPPGSGKSRQVWDFIRENQKTYFCLSNPTSNTSVLWAPPGARGEVCVIDDFDYRLWRRVDFLTLCDRYPLNLQTKGGFINFNSPFIYLTSNVNPLFWWPEDSLLQESWMRRITEIRYQ